MRSPVWTLGAVAIAGLACGARSDDRSGAASEVTPPGDNPMLPQSPSAGADPAPTEEQPASPPAPEFTPSPSGEPPPPPTPPTPSGATAPSAVDLGNGYPVLEAVADECPSGTRPSTRFICLDVLVCYCEYVCDPECGEGQVCTLDDAGDAACRCHTALEATETGCGWTGLVTNPSFDDESGWTTWSQSQGDTATASIADGVLQMTISQRCSQAGAATTARVPPASEFPDGAALVFDYHASTTPDQASIGVTLDGLQVREPLLATEQRREMRFCVSLPREPWLSPLVFSMYANGLCADSVDLRLTVDGVRLEADPNCR